MQKKMKNEKKREREPDNCAPITSSPSLTCIYVDIQNVCSYSTCKMEWTTYSVATSNTNITVFFLLTAAKIKTWDRTKQKNKEKKDNNCTHYRMQQPYTANWYIYICICIFIYLYIYMVSTLDLSCISLLDQSTLRKNQKREKHRARSKKQAHLLTLTSINIHIHLLTLILHTHIYTQTYIYI